MKTMRKALSMLLVAAMVMSLFCVAAFADNTSYTITINNYDTSKASDSYEAYQIFAGNLSADGVLSDITWGTGVDSTKIDALQTELGVSSAKEAAEKLDTNYTGTDKIAAATFADVVSKYLSGTYTTNTNDKIVVNAPGYYLIKNTDGSAEAGEAYTKFVMEVVKDCSFTPKTDAPEVVKKVKNADEPDSSYRDANNVAIGDTVNYQITSAVPDMKDYTQYYFIMNDTLSKGLTYTDGSMVVKVGETTLTATTSDTDQGTTYKLNKVVNADGTTSLEIVFSNFKQYAAGQPVTVTYAATLNSNAKVGSEGNPNNVDLTYSNNPNKTGKGTNKPNDDDDDVTGTTPKDWTITYTTNLGLYKYDGSDKTPLEGVTFTLTGVKNNDLVTFTQVFTADENGTYYKLNDGSYTTTVPNELNAKCYDSTTQKYSMTTEGGTYTESIDKVTITATTDANGYVNFGSLAAGEYEIVETATKDGYNMLTAPIKVVITNDSNSMTVTAGDETSNWTVTADGTAVTDKIITGETNTIGVLNIVNVENNKGSSLPSTGGMGTTLFYVLGAILVLGAGIVLVSRKRMANN